MNRVKGYLFKPLLLGYSLSCIWTDMMLRKTSSTIIYQAQPSLQNQSQQNLYLWTEIRAMTRQMMTTIHGQKTYRKRNLSLNLSLAYLLQGGLKWTSRVDSSAGCLHQASVDHNYLYRNRSIYSSSKSLFSISSYLQMACNQQNKKSTRCHCPPKSVTCTMND